MTRYRYGVTEDYEYNATHKRHRLTLWSGTFRDVPEGSALSTPTGYMITPYYGDKIRVECPSPRDDGNFWEVDKALSRALAREHVARLEGHADTWDRQADRLTRGLLDPGTSYARDAELAADSRREARRIRERADALRAELDAERAAEGSAA